MKKPLLVACTLLLMSMTAAASDDSPRPADEPALLVELSRGSKDAATALGELMSPRALRMIAEAGDLALLGAFEHGIARRPLDERTPLHPDIERLLIERFDDPVLGKRLLRLVHDGYSSRELFDRLYAHIADPGKFDANRYWYRLVVATQQPGVEEPLLRAVPRLDAGGRHVVLEHLARRGYAPALPEMLAFMKASRARPAELKDSYTWLALVGTRPAMEALSAEVESLAAAPPTPATRQSLADAVQALAGARDDAPVDVPRIVRAIAGKDEEAVRWSLIALARARPHPAASPHLIRLLGEPRHWQGALDALVAIDDPPSWRKGRERIDALCKQGTLPQGSCLYATTKLSRGIDHYDEYKAERERAARVKALNDEAEPIRKRYRRRGGFLPDDPASYVREALAFVAAMEPLLLRHEAAGVGSLRGDIRRDLYKVASLQRFELGQPREAIATALRTPDDSGQAPDLFAALQVAEIHRYELADSASAIRYYELARTIAQRPVEKGQGPAGEEPGAAFARWLDQEIAYLQTGKPFAGVIRREDLGGPAGYLALFAMSLRPHAFGEDPATARTALDAMRSMPPSHQHIVGLTYQLGAFKSTKEVLAHLERNDPARYLSATVIAGWDSSQRQMRAMAAHDPDVARALAREKPGFELPIAGQVSAQFRKKTGIRFATEPDPRRATPEKTWALFIASLQRGDRDNARDCYTGKLKEALGELFTKMSDEQLQQMASEFSPLEVSSAPDGSLAEYTVVRRGKDKKQLTFVQFVNAGGEWLIESM